MTLSTCTRTLAMRLVLVVSSSDKGRPLLVKAGRMSLTFKQKILDNNSSVSHHLITWTQIAYSRNPELVMMNLALYLPPYSGEINIIKPHGAIAMRNLIVLCP